MRIIADLHLHSKYSRATSGSSDLEGLSEWAQIKGIGLLGTADFTHPKWLGELKRKLKDEGEGVFSYKNTKFVLTTEVSNIFYRDNVGKKVHNILFAPSLEVVGQVCEALGKYGKLEEDGRPMLNLDQVEMVGILREISREIYVVPAHCWTPWFGVFGSKSGFDSLKEAFGEYEKDIFALETGLSCYDGETDILTENGWKCISKVSMDDAICTLNPKTEEIEYHKPTRTHKYRHQGKMYRLKTKRIDLCVTPNHNLFYSPCDFRNRKPFRLAEARFLFGKSKRFKKNGNWLGAKPEYFTLPAVNIRHGSRYYSGLRKKAAKQLPIKPWLRFFGFWLAEGWTTGGKDGNYSICICNNKKELLDEMRSILESFGYSVYQGKNIVRVRDFQLFRYLRQFGKASEKSIPPEIKVLSKDLLSLMFDYYIKGDGHRYGRSGKGLSATTISVKLRDDLQEIALKLGMSAYYKLHNPKGTPFSSPSQKKQYFQSADSWVIFFIRRNEHAVLPCTLKKFSHTEKWEDYDDYVYCVEVPNHVVYVRRNGIPVWCGNSDPSMNWMLSSLDRITLISNSDCHSPQKLGREANVLELEKLSYGAVMETIKTRKGFVKTYEFYPEEGKYHWDGHRNCGVRLSPESSMKMGDICPVCRKRMTIGVLHRVEELADRKAGEKPGGAVPFTRLIPLMEIIASVRGAGVGTKGVQEEYFKLVNYFGNEFAALEAPEENLVLASDKVLASAVVKARGGEVYWKPGYDGVFGEMAWEKPKEDPKAQKSLMDF